MRDYAHYFSDRTLPEKRGVSVNRDIDWWMGYAASHLAKLLFVVLLAILCLVIQSFIQLGKSQSTFPVENITLTGEVLITQPHDIETALDNIEVASFFETDIADVTARIEALPWIEQATVTRHWPSALTVDIVEREASYRWGDKELIDGVGNRFANIDNSIFGSLPKLDGVAGYESAVIVAYRQLMNELGGSAGRLDIDKFVLNQYLSWELHLKNGLVIKFGRDDYTQRIKRFTQVYQAGKLPDFQILNSIDFRYHRGFAVKWKPEFTPKSQEESAMVKVSGTEI